MRLINTETLELHEFFESQAPSYAILSHTWEKDEITFQEMVSKSPSTRAKAGYKKVYDTCRMAQTRGQQWAWIDTCCIDKSSSAELTESINSMYRWYQNAQECYAYLVDFAPGSLPQYELEKCRWFTRGFTLQELIAPKTVILFDRHWNELGERSDVIIEEIINRITRISRDVLHHRRPLSDYAIAERMLWASTRETTRHEDKAYCLLGIFEVNMPLIYGEGDNAFRRLQEEIIKRSNDLSIFAWGTPLSFQLAENGKSLTEHPSFGLFATSPADFGATWGHIGLSDLILSERKSIHNIPEFTLTNKGLNMGANMGLIEIVKTSGQEQRKKTYYTIYSSERSMEHFAVLLEKVGPGFYVRLGVGFVGFRTNIKFTTSRDGNHYASSTIANTILMDYRTLSESREEIFEYSVSIRWSSDLRIQVSRTLPHTHWDASRSLFFPPGGGFYGQIYDIACAKLSVFHYTSGTNDDPLELYVIIDFRHKYEGEIPRAFILGEDDLPEITRLIQQSHIPHQVLFPGHGRLSKHLLNKGPHYGHQKAITLGPEQKPRRMTIGIESKITYPPAEFECVLGRIKARKQYTVMLHATFEEDGSVEGSDASPTMMSTAKTRAVRFQLTGPN